jgi:hypothetical protein
MQVADLSYTLYYFGRGFHTYYQIRIAFNGIDPDEIVTLPEYYLLVQVFSRQA